MNTDAKYDTNNINFDQKTIEFKSQWVWKGFTKNDEIYQEVIMRFKSFK